MPETAVAVSVRQALARASELLRRAGCDTPRLDAELLLACTLGVARSRLVIDAWSGVDVDHLARFETLVARRSSREPVAYIIGEKQFRRITLSVDRRVLIPRPETELLVEVGLSLPAGWRVLDVGSGSGAVALALKHERADLSVGGVDVSPGAVALARENAARLGLDVQFVEGDLLAGLSCDAVLGNLPYVAEGTRLAPEIAFYEPGEALFAGADGLDVIRRLVFSLAGEISTVALEVGCGQADPVAALLAGAGFASVERLCDLAGHERVLVGSR